MTRAILAEGGFGVKNGRYPQLNPRIARLTMEPDRPHFPLVLDPGDPNGVNRHW